MNTSLAAQYRSLQCIEPEAKKDSQQAGSVRLMHHLLFMGINPYVAWTFTVYCSNDSQDSSHSTRLVA